jgi:hypothetical protein
MKLEHVRRRMFPLHALFWHVVVYSGANETKWKDKGIPESSCRKLLIVFYIYILYIYNLSLFDRIQMIQSIQFRVILKPLFASC